MDERQSDLNNDAVERFRVFLKERKLRTTRTRDAVVLVVSTLKGHFEVDDVVLALRKHGHEASRASVYRALPLLKEAGLIQETLLSGKESRYEATFGHAHHDHLICTGCGTVVEFEFEAFEVLQREVAGKYGFQLTGHVHELVGLCRRCRIKRKRN